MNNTIKTIIEDSRTKRNAVSSKMEEVKSQIADLQATLDGYRNEHAELTEVIEMLGATTNKEAATKHRIQWFNTDNLTDNYAAPVVVHGEGCNHIKISQRDPYMKAGFETVSDVEEWESAEKFAQDYNADFYEEAGNEGAWPIAFFPCTGMVERLTITTGYID